MPPPVDKKGLDARAMLIQSPGAKVCELGIVNVTFMVVLSLTSVLPKLIVS